MQTQAEVARSIVQQLRLLDPAISAEIGTPERKLIDVISQQIAERSIDLNQLQGVLDIDSKFGSDLDNFLGLFRFGRQQGSFATSFVTFSRNVASSYDIPIPRGTVVTANAVASDAGQGYTSRILFETTQSVTLRAGNLSIDSPVRATQVGVIGNVSVGEINNFGPSIVNGINTISNQVVGINGVDPESDEEFKVRFKNTVFRNVSGTTDQYLALAVATQFTTKANVVGPISRHVEFIQVPDKADSDGGNSTNSGNWTSALSSIPYSKHIYEDLPYYIIQNGVSNPYFLRREIDYTMNIETASKNRGDAYRLNSVYDSNGDVVNWSSFKPNVTFSGILSSSESPSAEGLREGDVVRFEHSYMSESSRNDYFNGILNCVDVFIDGVNEEYADAVLPVPSLSDQFVNNPSSARHYNNYRRLGEPEHRPVIGNLLQTLFAQPAKRVPDSIVIQNNTFYEGIHYWLVEDVSELGGTVRCRNGLEWNPNIPGKGAQDEAAGPYTGDGIIEISGTDDEEGNLDRIVELFGYGFNRNLIDLQTSLEADKQVTTDVLAHEAKRRYFKINLAVMYLNGASEETVNTQISNALSSHFKSYYFGSYIQLSDILQAVRGVAGVDNVRFSYDLLRENGVSVDSNGNPRLPIVECDINGNPLTRAIVDRIQQGTASTPTIDQLYLTGSPTAGNFAISYNLFNGTVELTTDGVPDVNGSHTINLNLPYNATAELIEQTLREEQGDFADSNSAQWNNSLSVTGTGAPTDPWRIEWFANNEQQTISLGGASSGSYRLVYDGQTTATIAHNASSATIQTALEDLSNIEVGDVSVTNKVVTFRGALAATNVDLMAVANNTTNGTPTVSTTKASTFGNKGALLAISELHGATTAWDSDFALKDDELPSIPQSEASGDSAPGLVVQVKSQSTWDKA
jgi:hypothetical protein